MSWGGQALRFEQSLDEGQLQMFDRSYRVPEAAALIVAREIVVENGLHLVDGLEPGASCLDTEVVVEERT